MLSERNIGITEIRKITDTLKLYRNIDLSGWAIISFKNRIERFLNNSSDNISIDTLLLRLKDDTNFYNSFLKEISVEKTEIFRNPSVWRFIRDKLIAELLIQKNPVQVWFPCTTSMEEVYSFAILIKEKNLQNSVRIKISYLFETWSKNELFPEMNLGKLELSQSNYQRFNDKGSFENYYSNTRAGFKINESLFNGISIETDIFNFESSDNAFKPNLLICRDFLIYTNLSMHDKIFSLFNSCMNRNSIVILGVKEQIAFCKEAKKYQAIDNVEGVYKKYITD